MRALKGWLTALRWTSTGEVSNIELAVDFEVYSGIDIPGPEGRPVAINQRAKTLWKMLSALCRVCEDLQLPPPLPAARRTRVGCLRTLGAPLVWGGLARRPHFAGGEETQAVLETCLPRAVCSAGQSDRNWGGDVFPHYDTGRRTQRAQRWEASLPVGPVRPELPQAVPAPLADPELRTQSVCNACAKQKCAACSVMRRNYSLTVDQCCAAHHTPDDGLKRQCCNTHKLTRCGTCPNAAACCSAGHHTLVSTPDDGDSGHDGDDDTPLQPPMRAKRRRPEAPNSPATPQSARRQQRRRTRKTPQRGLINAETRRKRAASDDEDISEELRAYATPSRCPPPRQRLKSDPSGIT